TAKRDRLPRRSRHRGELPLRALRGPLVRHRSVPAPAGPRVLVPVLSPARTVGTLELLVSATSARVPDRHVGRVARRPLGGGGQPAPPRARAVVPLDAARVPERARGLLSALVVYRRTDQRIRRPVRRRRARRGHEPVPALSASRRPS